MSDSVMVTVQLLDRYYTFRCSAVEKEQLQQAALLLDAKMREVRETQKMTVIERIAVAAGLSLSHELLNCQRDKDNITCEINQQVSALQEKIQNSLTQHEQMKL